VVESAATANHTSSTRRQHGRVRFLYVLISHPIHDCCGNLVLQQDDNLQHVSLAPKNSTTLPTNLIQIKLMAPINQITNQQSMTLSTIKRVARLAMEMPTTGAKDGTLPLVSSGNNNQAESLTAQAATKLWDSLQQSGCYGFKNAAPKNGLR